MEGVFGKEHQESEKASNFNSAAKLEKTRKFIDGEESDIIVTKGSVYEKKILPDGSFFMDKKSRETGESQSGVLDGTKFQGSILKEGNKGLLFRENGKVSNTSKIENLAVSCTPEELKELVVEAVSRVFGFGDYSNEEKESGKKTLIKLGYDIGSIKGETRGPEGLGLGQIIDQLEKNKSRNSGE